MSSYWKPPTPEEVTALRVKYRLSKDELADLGRVQMRAAQRWESAEGSISHRYPAWSAWELIMVKLGEESIDKSVRRRAAAARRGEQS